MMRLAVAGLLLTALTSCASVGDYFVDRGNDLADSARAKLMFGFGFGVKVEATQLVQLGWIWHDSWAVGLHNRGVGSWDEKVSSWGFLYGEHHEETFGLDRYSGSHGWVSGRSLIDALEVRVQGMGLLLGIDVELRLGQLLIDFPLGIFGLDPAGDDD